jgi:S1-C subfamily serine protease
VDIHAGPHGLWQGFDDNHPFGGLSVPRSGGGTRSFTPFPLAGEMRTDRLGVGVEIPTADERKAAHIDEGVGLKVAHVESNSIASKIGIEPGDVVIEVNGRSVKGVPDVLEVLAQRRGDQDVVVTLVDTEGKKRTLTWRAPAVSADRLEDKRKL